MQYQQLSPEYVNDTLAAAMYEREREHFHYALDHANFTDILKTQPDGEYKDMLIKRRDETADRMAEVDKIYAALATQIKDQTAYDAAVIRTSEKRAASESTATIIK